MTSVPPPCRVPDRRQLHRRRALPIVGRAPRALPPQAQCSSPRADLDARPRLQSPSDQPTVAAPCYVLRSSRIRLQPPPGPPHPRPQPPTSSAVTTDDQGPPFDHATTRVHTTRTQEPENPATPPETPTQSGRSPGLPARAASPPETSDKPFADEHPAPAPIRSGSPHQHTHSNVRTLTITQYHVTCSNPALVLTRSLRPHGVTACSAPANGLRHRAVAVLSRSRLAEVAPERRAWP